MFLVRGTIYLLLRILNVPCTWDYIRKYHPNTLAVDHLVSLTTRYPSFADMMPLRCKGLRKLPLGTENALFSLSPSSNGIDQYADASSSFVQNIYPPILSITSLINGKWYVSFFVTSLSALKSHTNLKPWSFFFNKHYGCVPRARRWADNFIFYHLVHLFIHFFLEGARCLEGFSKLWQCVIRNDFMLHNLHSFRFHAIISK